jgi:hypothetical protein
MILGDADQRQMPGVECAHGRHERDRFSSLPPSGDLRPEVVYRSDRCG